MSGTIPLSMTQQFDVYGKPLAGGQLYLMVAGTVSTPQDGFQDPGLTIKMPYPITLDAAGRIPQFFLADGLIKVRLQDKTGVVQLASDNIQVIGPSSGGGGGGATIDPTTIFQTGDLKPRHGYGPFAGWVRANDLTIGSVTSGATERANSDCQNLFLYLWNDGNIVVVGGRGASGAADWAANKQIKTPDYRGYALAGLDGMGNALAGRLTAGYFGGSPDVIGAVGGLESNLLDLTKIPLHFHQGTSDQELEDHGHLVHTPASKNTQAQVVVGASAFFWTGSGPDELSGGRSAKHTHPFTTDIRGGGLPHANVQPTKLCTVYIKL